MAYKTGAQYLIGEDYYTSEPFYVVGALESCSDTMCYKVISGGRVISTYCEDDCATDNSSELDMMCALKANAKSIDALRNQIKNDLTREEIDNLFLNDRVPKKFGGE